MKLTQEYLVGFAELDGKTEFVRVLLEVGGVNFAGDGEAALGLDVVDVGGGDNTGAVDLTLNGAVGVPAVFTGNLEGVFLLLAFLVGGVGELSTNVDLSVKLVEVGANKLLELLFLEETLGNGEELVVVVTGSGFPASEALDLLLFGTVFLFFAAIIGERKSTEESFITADTGKGDLRTINEFDVTRESSVVLEELEAELGALLLLAIIFLLVLEEVGLTLEDKLKTLNLFLEVPLALALTTPLL